jgi:hypothetical protein
MNELQSADHQVSHLSTDAESSRGDTRLYARIFAATVLSLTGCSAFDGVFNDKVGEVELVALGSRPLLLGREMVSASYVRKESEDSFWFADVPLEALLAHDKGTPLRNAMFVHAQLLWYPKPGMTPLDSTATNLTLRVVIVSEGEMGIYGGAGFARPKGDPTEGPMTLAVEGGTLTLLEKTAGFQDLLSPVGFASSLSAPLEPDTANRWRRAVSQFATNALGKSIWVRANGAMESTKRTATDASDTKMAARVDPARSDSSIYVAATHSASFNF